MVSIEPCYGDYLLRFAFTTNVRVAEMEKGPETPGLLRLNLIPTIACDRVPCLCNTSGLRRADAVLLAVHFSASLYRPVAEAALPG